MDILNFISWIKGKRIVTSVDPSQTLIPVGLKDNRKGDDYLAGAISVHDLSAQMPAGPQGPIGLTGATGLQGIAGPVGPAGLTWQSTWSELNSYILDDAVGYAGASWYCINPVGPAIDPPDVDTTNWALLASQGSPGVNGGAGVSGPIGLTGLDGAPGLTGPQGPQGVAGPVGPAGLNWQGAWASGVSYVTDDAVGFGGASYFCILATSGIIDPSLDTTHWALLASQGSPGVQGAQGLPGAAGLIAGIKKLGVFAINGTVITGGVASTPYVSASIFIPANTLETNSIIETSWGLYKTTTSGTVQSHVYVNTINSLSGATRIATGANQNPADLGFIRNLRDFQKIGNTLYTYNATQQNASDITSTSNSRTTIPITPTAGIYVLFCVWRANILDSASIGRIRMTEHF